LLQQYVIGVFASDTLPRRQTNRVYGLIVNTDPHNKSGQHWCAIYSDASGNKEFFDSYGRPPEKNSIDIQTWISARADAIHYNKSQLQSENSSVCGLYCLLYLRQRLMGLTLQQFLEQFDRYHLEANDDFVTSIISQAYPDCVSNTCYFNQSCISLNAS
jgi:hypothetical protein